MNETREVEPEVMPDKPPHNWERSAETEALLRYFDSMEPGKPVPMFEVSRAVGFNITHEKHRGKLRSARDIYLKEKRGKIDMAKWELRKLTDEELVASKQHHFRRKASRAAKRGADVLRSVEYTELSQQQRVEYNAGLSAFGATRAALSASSQKKLQALAAEEKRYLPSADALKYLGDKEKK